ncbi:HlyU family transcriptional regulator [Nioella aestuarii]|uniref:HlyU family transcriptional regulator n=1 Tax=Nioella aestuarii TaxID=1662864 RepID=UPI003D7FEB89
MSLFKKLFGGSGTPKGPEPVVYNGYTILPEPVKEPDGYRIAARIEKEIAGELKTHHLIRADVLHGPDQAAEASIEKAKSMIDQMGDRIF